MIFTNKWSLSPLITTRDQFTVKLVTSPFLSLYNYQHTFVINVSVAFTNFAFLHRHRFVGFLVQFAVQILSSRSRVGCPALRAMCRRQSWRTPHLYQVRYPCSTRPVCHCKFHQIKVQLSLLFYFGQTFRDLHWLPAWQFVQYWITICLSKLSVASHLILVQFAGCRFSASGQSSVSSISPPGLLAMPCTAGIAS